MRSSGNSGLSKEPSDGGGESADRPLAGMLVLDFSQFLSGPSAGLRLADFGARVIKIERAGIGDICRTLYISNLVLDGDSSIFHAINRNKESFAADLRKEEDVRDVRELVRRADVVIQNFRPGVMERLGFDYESVRRLNPAVVYGEITGYGGEGPWKDTPGQDLLVQSRSGLVWLNGDRGQPPVPFGLAIADMLAGAHLTQGILAGLVRRSITGAGSRVQVSLLESVLDYQADALTTYLNNGGEPPERSVYGHPHPYAEGPSGIYPTADGCMAIHARSFAGLAETMRISEIAAPASRDDRKRAIAAVTRTRTTSEWLRLLAEPGSAAEAEEVLAWDRLMSEDGFQALDMIQEIGRTGGPAMRTTRCPVRIDGRSYKSAKGSPRVGEHTETIRQELREWECRQGQAKKQSGEG